jgi:hypothetical protein
MSFKDPKTGDSMFSIIGLDKFKLIEFKKAIDLRYDNGDRFIKNVYSMILDIPFEDSIGGSMFKRAADISKPVLNIYLMMLAEIEHNHSLSSQVIPDCKAIKRMVNLPGFQEYMEACYKPVVLKAVYKGNWIHRKTQMDFLIKSTMDMDDKYMATNFGPVVDKKALGGGEAKEEEEKDSHVDDENMGILRRGYSMMMRP